MPFDDSTDDDRLDDSRYLDEGQIGRGGMGSIRRVIDRELLRESAVKVLSPRLGLKESRVNRFQREARITGQLEHPNIVPIYELSVDGRGNHFINMRLVEGETLEEIVERLGEKGLHAEHLARTLQILLKVCDALAYAHSRGVIHRDIKPSNIMVGDFGQVYLMDWGVAHLLPRVSKDKVSKEGEGSPIRHVEIDPDGTMQVNESYGSVIGTPRYMPPEQVQGQHDKVDQRSDIFALGATLFHVLTGHAPYTAKSYVHLLLQAQDVHFTTPREEIGERIPAQLERIALKAMAPAPDARYASVIAFKKDLERFLSGAWHLPTRCFAAGELIVREGDEAEEAYVIVDGECVAFDDSGPRRVELRRMGPGDVFGETAIFGRTRRTASVEALGELKVMVVTREILSSGLGLSSWMGEFVKALAERFSEADQKLRHLEQERLEPGDD